MAEQRAHLVIHGRVQGVFFRASAQEKAIKLGLTGWVRNTVDGAVEVIAEGERKKLEALVEWCRMGPPDAYVTDIEVEWEPYTGEFRGFLVKYRER